MGLDSKDIVLDIDEMSLADAIKLNKESSLDDVLDGDIPNKISENKDSVVRSKEETNTNNQISNLSVSSLFASLMLYNFRNEFVITYFMEVIGEYLAKNKGVARSFLSVSQRTLLSAFQKSIQKARKDDSSQYEKIEKRNNILMKHAAVFGGLYINAALINIMKNGSDWVVSYFNQTKQKKKSQSSDLVPFVKGVMPPEVFKSMIASYVFNGAEAFFDTKELLKNRDVSEYFYGVMLKENIMNVTKSSIENIYQFISTYSVSATEDMEKKANKAAKGILEMSYYQAIKYFDLMKIDNDAEKELLNNTVYEFNRAITNVGLPSVETNYKMNNLYLCDSSLPHKNEGAFTSVISNSTGLLGLIIGSFLAKRWRNQNQSKVNKSEAILTPDELLSKLNALKVEGDGSATLTINRNIDNLINRVKNIKPGTNLKELKKLNMLVKNLEKARSGKTYGSKDEPIIADR